MEPLEPPRRDALAFGGFLVSAFVPPLVTPDLQWVAAAVGGGCLIYGLWPRVRGLKTWLNSRAGGTTSWFITAALPLVIVLAITLVWRTIDRYRYHLSYQLCRNHTEVQTPTGPMVGTFYLFVRLLNENRYALVSKVESNSLTLNGIASDGEFTDNEMPVTPHAKYAMIVDRITFPQPLPLGTTAQGRIRYVIKYGPKDRPEDKRMVISGKLEVTFNGNGMADVVGFVPDVDSDPNFVSDDCILTPKRNEPTA